MAHIFGAALDFLDDPERVGLKLSYLDALRDGLVPADLPADPYDAIAHLAVAARPGRMKLAGKVAVPGWLTPRPGAADRAMIGPASYRAFMDAGGRRAL